MIQDNKEKNMKAIRLRTEYLKNPIGVDFIKPRFF